MNTSTVEVHGKQITPSSNGRFTTYDIIIDGDEVHYFSESSRTVFDFDDDHVLKVECGSWQNKAEYDAYQRFVEGTPEVLPFLAKVVDFVEQDGVSFLVQERLTGDCPRVDDDAYIEATVACKQAVNVLHGWSRDYLCDNGTHQWKLDKDGVPKCHDFALWLD